MPSKKVVESWGYDCIGFESDNDNNVKKIWCKVCREYSTVIGNVGHAKKGVAKISSEIFVKGTSVVKKNNFKEHVQRSQTHASAVLRVSERSQVQSLQIYIFGLSV